MLEAPSGSRALLALPIARGNWFASSIVLEGDDHLRVAFQERGSGDLLEITLLPRDAPPPVTRRLERCALRYTVRLSDASAQRKAEAAALVMGVASVIDARLVAGAATIAEALGRDRRDQRLVFGRDSLRALLAPEITAHAPLAGGFELHDVYPTSHVRHAVDERLELVIEFRRDLLRLRFAVGARDDEKPAWLRTPHFNVSELKGATTEPEGAVLLRALLGFVLQVRDHAGLDVVFPDVLADLSLPALAAAPAEERRETSLNLALDAECGQSCEFCSIKEVTPAYDGGDAVFRRAVTDLGGARARGISHLRLNGYDPLAYSQVLAVLERAVELGFDRVDVFSPATRLADRGFCAELLARLPATRTFWVPLYGADAALHDRVVGRPGAFALVVQALDNLRALAGPQSIRILTVATRSNLDALGDIEAFARARGVASWVHLPYPSYEGRSDKFFDAVPRQETVAAACVRAYDGTDVQRVFPVRGVAPCVVFRTLTPRGVAPWRWLGIERRPLPGTEYASKPIEHGEGVREGSAAVAATVPCRHARDCALASECGGELLRSYVERHGEGEFVPVSLGALLDACRSPRGAS